MSDHEMELLQLHDFNNFDSPIIISCSTAVTYIQSCFFLLTTSYERFCCISGKQIGMLLTKKRANAAFHFKQMVIEK